MAQLGINCGRRKMLCPTVRISSPFFSCLRIPIILISFFIVVAPARAQSPIRITGPVEDSSRAVLAQSRLAVLSGAREIAPLDPQENLNRMVLAMKIAPGQQADLKALLESQQTRGSQNYHAWLTPEEFGRRFGPAPEDLAKVSGWLQQEGFRVDSVAKSGMWIQFSGTAGQVNSAFRTEMHRFEIGGETHIANASDISIPAALVPLVEGVPLHDFFSKPTFVDRHAPQLTANPEITAPWNSAITAIVPGDFATIYDLNPLYQAGLNGSGQTIAIVAEADVTPSDIATFQQLFGLPSNPPNVIVTGADPGTDLVQGYGAEATIDTEWAVGVAPGATVDLVVSSPSNTTDGVALAAMYIVEQNLAQIVSASYRMRAEPGNGRECAVEQHLAAGSGAGHERLRRQRGLGLSGLLSIERL
jgi:subtilase family serine protease